MYFTSACRQLSSRHQETRHPHTHTPTQGPNRIDHRCRPCPDAPLKGVPNGAAKAARRTQAGVVRAQWGDDPPPFSFLLVLGIAAVDRVLLGAKHIMVENTALGWVQVLRQVAFAHVVEQDQRWFDWAGNGVQQGWCRQW